MKQSSNTFTLACCVVGPVLLILLIVPKPARAAGATVINMPTGNLLDQPDFPVPEMPSREDLNYLRQIARDTWKCIGDMADPRTGMPYDSDQRPEFTSVSNIGMYLSLRDCGSRPRVYH